MTHLFDTSALLCLYFREPGSERLAALLADPASDPGLSALSLTEFWAVLKRLGREDRMEQDWPALRPLFSEIVPATESVVLKALALRRVAMDRLPAMDAVIAATAAVHGAVLLHRDAHLRTVPAELLRQEFLE